MVTRDRPEAQHVAICVCTYRRPVQLGRLLDSLLAIASPASTSFVIVDNDGNDAALERCVSEFRARCGCRVEYAIETAAGISAARNRAVALARALDVDAIAMIDDDEWASPEWLASLLETRARTGAAVVGGPVRPVFPLGCEHSSAYRRLWSIGNDVRHGKIYISSTSNCLVDSAALDANAAPFEEAFGLTGGEDSVFFRRLFFAGVPMAWAASAVVFEEVTRERASFTWMRRRWYRQGNVGVACERAAPDPRGLPPIVRTLLLSVRLVVFPLFRRGVLSAPLLWLLECERIRGRIARHLGFEFREYARDEKATAK